MGRKAAPQPRLRNRGNLQVGYIIAIFSGLVFGVSVFTTLSFRGVLDAMYEQYPTENSLQPTIITSEATAADPPSLTADPLPPTADLVGATVEISHPNGGTTSSEEHQQHHQVPDHSIGTNAEEALPQGDNAVKQQVSNSTSDKAAMETEAETNKAITHVVPSVEGAREEAVAPSDDSNSTNAGSVGRSEATTRGPFRIIVLSMNRPWALTRLLDSIAAVDYGQDDIKLDIFVDMQRSNFRHDEETVEIANAFQWTHGEKRIVLQPQPMGLILAWLTCWNATSDNDRAVMLEDDLEVSPLYYRFLREADDKYRDVEDLAAFSLQRATLIPRDEGFRQIQHGESHQHSAYMYKLVGTWGFAPRARHWTQFQAWFFERYADKEYKPYVDGLKINKWYNGREWSNWFLRFCEEENLFNLYGNMPEKSTLCANWREPGEHYGKGPAKGREFEIFEADNDHDFRLPEVQHLLRLDWNGQLHPAFHSEFHRVNMEAIDSLVDFAQGSEFLTLGLYNGYFSGWVKNFLCNVKLLEARPEKLMFVTNDWKAHSKMVKEGIPSTLMKFQGAESARGTTFSTPGYIEFMLNRARLVMMLLRRGVTTLLFDPDQTWLEDPMPYLRQKLQEGGVDLIGSVTTQEELAGNFLLFCPTECTVSMYSDLLKHFESVFEEKDIGNVNRTADKVTLSNDQTLITSFALRQNRCNLALLDRELFCDGRWYKGAYSDIDPSVRPVIVNNNFVEGNDEKLHRAAGFGHLFHNTRTNTCEQPQKLRAYYKTKSVYYTWQQVLDKVPYANLINASM